MKISDENLLAMAMQLAAGDPQYYLAMTQRAKDRPDAADIALPAKLLVEYFSVVREAAAMIEAGVAVKLPYNPEEAKALEWSPG
ncbi:MAG: hypothetical protein JNJ55_06075 [Betaproteobacteria bacterium]|nr:hypothetical protein [Betaproteobacteria bacterium]